MTPFSKLKPVCLAFLLGLFLSPAVFAQNSEEAAAFQEAERYYAAGIAQSDRYEKGRYMNYVIKLYTRYLDLYSGSKNEVAARFHLGYARQTLGQIEAARDIYRFLISRHKRGPYVGSAARQMAYLALVEEKWQEGATYFSVAASNLADQSLRNTALTKEVECLLKLNKNLEATIALRRILESQNHPHKDWARFLLGYQYFMTDKFEATIGTLRPLLEENPGGEYRSQAIFYTGLASAELGQDDAQDSHLRTILDMPMNHPSLTREQRRHLATNKAKAQTSLMGLYTKKKEWDTVIDLYERGDFGATGKTEARRSMRGGKAYLIRQEYQEARSCFRRVDRALPETETAFEASFLCLVCDYHLSHPGLSQRVDIFLELYARAFPNHPNLHQARFFKGETLFALGQMEEAAVAFNTIDAELLEPVFREELFFKKGWALGESGQFDGAIRSFSRLLGDFPKTTRRATAFNKRGEAHLALGDHTSALRDFEAVLAIENAAPEQFAFALQGSALVLRFDKNYESMIERYRRLLADTSNLPLAASANANYRIGWGYHKVGKYPDASPYLRKARDLLPEYYSQPVGDLLILGAFEQRDRTALHTAFQEVFRQAPAKLIPRHILTWLGVQMFHSGDALEASMYLEKATDNTKPATTDLPVWRILAKARNRAGQFEKAEATSLLLLDQKLEPRWRADAFLDLAEARLGMKKFAEALEATDKGLALEVPGPHLAGFQLVRGEIALAQDRWDDALQVFEKTIPMIPDDPLLQPRALHGGYLAAIKTGDQSLANDFQKKLKERFPDWKGW